MAEPLRPGPAAAGRAAYAAVDLIRAKRDGVALTADEIRWLMGAYLSGEVADEQMSALLMAIYFRGLDAPSCAAGHRRWWTPVSGWTWPASACLPWTSIRPGAWATRSPWFSPRWSRPVARPCRSCRAVGSATPAAPWTSWNRSPGWRAALPPAEMLGILATWAA